MANISHMILLMFFLSTFFSTNYAVGILNTRPPAVFIFGDSTSDVGTNNYIDTTVQSNHKFYGIDYEDEEATGRWSNGKNMIDYLCYRMGFERSPPPYLKDHPRGGMPTKIKMGEGFNFASGGSGLLFDTYEEGVVSGVEQLVQFAGVNAYLVKSMGLKKANVFLSKCIFIVSIGSNDIIRTFKPNETSLWPSIYIPEYMDDIQQTIGDLYGRGARRFGFVSPLPIGCLPMIRKHNDTGGCITEQNEISILFYKQLNTLLSTLGKSYPGFIYSLGNTYKILMDIISESKNPATACCGSGKLNAETFCNENTYLCDYRDEYAFWDGAHPTEISAGDWANKLYAGDRKVTTPMNFGEMIDGRTWSM